jgi:hypothetical protein
MTGSDHMAFPIAEPTEESNGGLTKRELFAAMAMQGICQNPNHIGGYLSASIEAVKQADALINALRQNPPKQNG